MDNPVVTLAGKQYPVPPLVPKQQRVVIPVLMKIAASFRKSEGRFDLSLVTTEFYDDILGCVYWGAVWPNDKQAPRSVMDEMPTSLNELMAAINVIREQTGLFRPAAEAATPGESQPVNGG